MAVNIIDQVVECPNCRNPFYRLDKNAVEVETAIGELVEDYIYCSQKCMDEKLSNVNYSGLEFKVKLVEKKQTSVSPIKWTMCFETDDLANVS